MSIRYLIKLKPLFGFTLLFISSYGCALQSTTVDMESDLETLKTHQRQLQSRVERIEKEKGPQQGHSSSAQPAPSSKGQADLSSRLDGFGSDLQALGGRVDEKDHLLTMMAKRIEDQSFKIEELLNRLDALEARAMALEKGTGRPPEPREGKTVIPGKNLDSRLKGMSPTEAFNLAYNDYLKGNYDLAIAGFQGFMQQYPGSALTPQAIYWIGESYYNKRAFAKAIESFDQVQQEYPKSEKAPNALLKQGFAYVEMGDRVKGRLYLKKVIEQFPSSNEANLAKDKLSDLR